MVADFTAAEGDCFEQEARVEKAMLVHNSAAHTFRGECIKLQRMKKPSRGKKTI
jgi:hypothetical protein